MEVFLLKALPVLIMGAWEYFLGKTTVIDANSTIEIAEKLVKKALKK